MLRGEGVIAHKMSRLVPEVIYVFSNGTNVKVGVTTDIERRWSALQGCHDRPLMLHFVVEMENGKAAALERSFHTLMKGSKWHISGEWYRLTAGEAARNVMQLVHAAGIRFHVPNRYCKWDEAA